MPRTTLIGLVLFAAGAFMPARADSIVYRGREYSGVIVEELTNQYVVHFPETGRKKYFSKEDVSSVEISGKTARSARPVPDAIPGISGPLLAPEPSEPPAPSPQQAALEEYKRRQQIRAQAEYEAAFEHWSKLEEDQRTALLSFSAEQAAAAENEWRQLAETADRTRQELGQRLETLRANIQRAVSERDQQVNEVYNAALDNSGSSLYGYLNDREAEEADVLSYVTGVTPEEFAEDVAQGYIRGNRRRANPYARANARRLADAMDAAQAEADRVAQDHNTRIAADNLVLRQVLEEQRNFERSTRPAIQRCADQARRTAGLAQYLKSLDDALAGDFEPGLTYRTLFSVQGKGVVQRDVSVAAPLMRVDWWLDTADPRAGQFTVRVYDNATQKIVRTETSANKPPSNYFLVIGEPGEFLIEAEGPEGLTYTLEGRELQDSALPPIGNDNQ